MAPGVLVGRTRPVRHTTTVQIQLWSYNYAPEAIGIAPVSTTWANTMAQRGHAVDVVAAHPHYPTAGWGTRLRPYRETRGDIPVLRLPLWIGHGTGVARMRQEATYAAMHAAATFTLARPEVLVSVSPSFPLLAPTIAYVRTRRLPWVLWIQDLLPDAAINTGLIPPGKVADMARRLEAAAYRHATRIVLISENHRSALITRGVPDDKLNVITNPTTLGSSPRKLTTEHFERPRILSLGNIGLSQGLVELTSAFESSAEMERRGVTLHFAGDGALADDVRAAIRSDRTRVLGIIPGTIGDELQSATVGLVGQHPSAGEFNMPSRLMTLMAHGIPVIAVVSPDSEVARVVKAAGAGWVIDAQSPENFPTAVAEILDGREDVRVRGEAAALYAQRHFTPAATAGMFERVLSEAVEARGTGSRRSVRSSVRLSLRRDQ